MTKGLKPPKATRAVKPPAEVIKAYRFKPGVCANPAGRPPGRSVHKNVRDAAVSKVEEWFNLIFIQPSAKTKKHIEENWEQLSLADQVMLGGVDMERVQVILDRIMGRAPTSKSPEGDTGESVENFFRRILKPEEPNGEARTESKDPTSTGDGI